MRRHPRRGRSIPQAQGARRATVEQRMMALLRRLHRNRSQIKFSSRPRRAAISLFIYDGAIYDSADARDLQTPILTIETDRAACPIGGTGAPPQPRGGVEHHADDGTPRPIPLGAHNKTMVEQSTMPCLTSCCKSTSEMMSEIWMLSIRASDVTLKKRCAHAQPEG